MDATSSTVTTASACASILRSRVQSASYDCRSDTGHSFVSSGSDWRAPLTNDLPFICASAACKSVLDTARNVATTDCIANEGSEQQFLYRDILNPVIRACAKLNGTSSKSANGEAPLMATWTTVETSSPTTLAPSTSTTNDPKDSGRTIAMVLGVVFIVLFIVALMSCACQETKSEKKPSRQQNRLVRRDVADGIPRAPAVYVKIVENEKRPRRSKPKPSVPMLSPSNAINNFNLSTFPLLQDEQIIAVRVPFDKISFGARINRGDFGEVYNGTYKGEVVAIKQLLPERRGYADFVNSFLEEAKLMSSLEHEGIVSFVGVAWDKVSDICVLSEFMEGGDLRSLLARYEAKHRPEGFDRTKIQIALHVAHALTYMHSLQPIVLHRDLKSSNILLTHDLDAKITDFGVSRELVEVTMTRGVGTSLWMAPEIMMGGRYDEKADIFTFGVVLSELDSNKLPYASQLGPKTNYSDLLQRVAQGRLTVDFSYESDPDIVALGRDCVAMDPKDRPSAAEALHRIHLVLRQYEQSTAKPRQS